MQRREALRFISILPINQLQNLPGVKTYQIYLSEKVPIEVFYKGQKVTLDPAEIFEALKRSDTA